MLKNTISIGRDSSVHRIGLGTNRIHDTEQSKEALRHAVALGIDFIDTASAYSSGQSEEVIGEMLAPYGKVLIATKGGMVAPDFRIDASPKTLERQLDASLTKLKLKTIPLYFLHRVDPQVPLKESLLFLKEMQKEGKIKHIGLSQVSIEQIEEARNYVEIVAIENEYNLSARMYDDVIAYAEKENMVFIPFFPLHFDASQFRILQQMREKYNATPEQLALAWLLKRSPVMLPIPGSLSETHLRENSQAMHIQLSDEDFERLSNR
ncbi:MAG TPA: aldo/keto reductase [Candidatus Saccharimonadales bacterium]|nr:aldo/keto reductase [Candidatus Saccharimonadales bacterium]